MVFSVLIVAAGNSTRMGGENKQLLTVGELPVIVRSAEAFRGIPDHKRDFGCGETRGKTGF